jgi:hypothetical protein
VCTLWNPASVFTNPCEITVRIRSHNTLLTRSPCVYALRCDASQGAVGGCITRAQDARAANQHHDTGNRQAISLVIPPPFRQRHRPHRREAAAADDCRDRTTTDANRHSVCVPAPPRNVWVALQERRILTKVKTKPRVQEVSVEKVRTLESTQDPSQQDFFHQVPFF